VVLSLGVTPVECAKESYLLWKATIWPWM